MKQRQRGSCKTWLLIKWLVKALGRSEGCNKGTHGKQLSDPPTQQAM